MSDIVPVGFDYSALALDDALFAQRTAERIRVRMRRTVDDIIDIGQDLLAAKDRLPHGQFGVWLQAEFDMTDRTAQNFMNVASRFGGKSETVSDLSHKVLYFLAAPSTPDTVVERVASGEIPATIQDVRAAKEEARRARQEADEARKQSQAAAQQLSFEKQLAATREAKLRALEAQAQREPEVIERVVEVQVEVVPPNLTAQLDAMQANLAQSEAERKKLAVHAAQLEQDAIAAGRLAQKEDKPDWRIRNAWAEQATALIRALQQGLAAYPSPAETFALQQYEWGLASEVRKLLARHQECLDAMQRTTIVDAA